MPPKGVKRGADAFVSNVGKGGAKIQSGLSDGNFAYRKAKHGDLLYKGDIVKGDVTVRSGGKEIQAPKGGLMQIPEKDVPKKDRKR